jgi:NAD(P)-dependent dehydrogenase (short-subunit alcohol dehydrogenase family)
VLTFSSPQWWLAALFVVVGTAFAIAVTRRSPRDQRWRYDPVAAWLRAFSYFAFAWALAMASGTVPTILDNAWVFPGQGDDVLWWLFTAVCVVVVFVGYVIIWPRDTRPHGRRVVLPDTVVFGVVWGISEGLGFASVWVLSTRAWRSLFGDGVAAGIGSYVTTIVVLSMFVGMWHQLYWDIHIAPEHNVIDANLKKVALAHTPNVLLTTAYLTVYENLGIFVVLQTFALLASAVAMPFPTFRTPLPVDPDGARLGPRTDEPVDLTGRTIVILGGASWLGRAAAARFAGRGARVVIIDHDAEELDRVAHDLTGRTGALIDCVPVEVTDARSASDAVALMPTGPTVDAVLLVANRWTTASTAPGHPSTMVATNHLGPWALVDALEPRLADDARIVQVVTDAHFQSRPGPDDDLATLAQGLPGDDAKGVPAAVVDYGLAAVLSVACAQERAQRWAGRGITVNILNPGGTVAWLDDEAAHRSVSRLLRLGRRSMLAVDACDYACTSPELDGVSGWYVKDRRPIRPSLVAQDPAFRERAVSWTQAEVAVTR